MIEEIKSHWWWLTAIGGGLIAGVRWMFGLQSQIDKLTDKQLADNAARVNDVQRVEAQVRTLTHKVDDIAEGIARVEAQNAMMISILNAKK